MISLTTFIQTHNADLGEPFAQVMSILIESAKTINTKLSRNGLIEERGDSGTINVYGEPVQKLDEYANDLLTKALLSCPVVRAVGSEELAQPKFSAHKGSYIITLDPLDGSTNIDTNLPVATIFGIYPNHETLLQKGSSLVASGYILYGPSLLFIYATPGTVNGFTYDTQSGKFILSYPSIRIGNQKIYSINEGNWKLFSDTERACITGMKMEGVYSLRYTGSMVADVHRTLFKGGIFMYPADSKHPSGKVRLLYEVAPLGFLMTQAGGAVTSNGTNPLDLLPEKHDQRVPVAIGSIKEVQKYNSFHR